MIDGGKLRVVRLVGLPPLVVLKALADHAEGEYEDERGDGAEGLERRDEGNALHDGAEQEVDVCISFELDDECEWKEGQQIVFGGRDVVGTLVLGL